LARIGIASISFISLMLYWEAPRRERAAERRRSRSVDRSLMAAFQASGLPIKMLPLPIKPLFS
jgi:hypothetical protein